MHGRCHDYHGNLNHVLAKAIFPHFADKTPHFHVFRTPIVPHGAIQNANPKTTPSQAEVVHLVVHVGTWL